MTSTTEESAATKTTLQHKAVGSADVVDVTIHPLVLLSAADHYHRVARGTRKRVVGVLLGQVHKGRVDATNSFAVPFEEDSRNPAVFYLDHNFLENMLIMFRKVTAKERVVGFYSTGPTIRPNDLRIFDVVQRFAAPSTALNPPAVSTSRGSGDAPAVAPSPSSYPAVFCIIDVRPDRTDLPVTAYKVVEQMSGGGKASTSGGGGGGLERSFAHVPSQLGALEAEEIGVEHLLRDINDPTVSTVASLVKGKLAGLNTLTDKLLECKVYLESVIAGNLKPHPEIIANLQTILSLLPNLNQQNLVRAMIVKTNDMLAAIYLASIIRSVIALHDLVNNKIRYGEDGTETKPANESAAGKEEEKKEDDEKATKASGDKKKEGK